MTNVLILIQIFFTIVMGLYFFNALKSQQTNKVTVNKENRKEVEELKRLKSISLTDPLTEKSRPTNFEEIVGQEKGILALKAAICGPNPQHVIIYGPPGVGKTAAARLVLNYAVKRSESPFREGAKFTEIDATTVRFDDRGIADPLIGSVHDPIYQGAGPLGIAGIPQPKPGAVTKAHGGILFIDEIGELHPIEMNKLLKVLEDRKVYLDSAYYNSNDPNVPPYIKDIFENGLPADFRLIGATTRSPNEIIPALRSRCVEIFFRALLPEEIEKIAVNAALKIKMPLTGNAPHLIGKYAQNGRDAVNIVQLAAGIAINDKRKEIIEEDIEWVIENGQYSPRPESKIQMVSQVGYVNGLAVYGANMGTILPVEATANKITGREGKLKISGIVEQEEITSSSRKIVRKSMVRSSVENVMTVLENIFGIRMDEYDIHVNFPGGGPVDGPSAGVSIATAVYSAVKGLKVDNSVAMTGELSLYGKVKPIGGVNAKIQAARKAGVKRVIIPIENYQSSFKNYKGIDIISVKNINEVLKLSLVFEHPDTLQIEKNSKVNILSAGPLKM